LASPLPAPLDTFIVVPCYNEAARFQVEQFRSFLALHPSVSFVLVSDGSRDETVSVLKRVEQGFESRTHIIDRKENRGKAETVREGMLYALENRGADIVGFWDADLATPLEAIFDMLDVLASRPEIQMVFGARVKLLGRDIRRKTARHYLGRVFATVVSTMLRLPIYDTQCGAKLFRATDDVRRICEEPFLTRWVFDVELIARWIRLNRFDLKTVEGSIYEYPLHAWEDVAGSKLKPSDFLKGLLDVVRIYRKYL
jgi:glycosyltransferase involved in cell wall biosynthesis